MKSFHSLTVASLLTGLLGAMADPVVDEMEKKTTKGSRLKRAALRPMRSVGELPDDPALPALVAIRAACATIPDRGEDACVDLRLCGYTPASRATIEARIGRHRFAVKAYAEEPTAEAELYQALGEAGLAGASGVRVPPLLAWEPDLQMLVIGWLEGSTARELIEAGRGARAGELAGRWIQRAVALPIRRGRVFGGARMLHRARQWVANLDAAGVELGGAARVVAKKLAESQPEEIPCLVHGTFYARHVLDLGDAVGVIDWQRSGQGPIELDAGMFLATVRRAGVRDESLSNQADRAEAAFLEAIRGLVNLRALQWHQAAALLRLADLQSKTIRRQGDWREKTAALLREANRSLECVG